MESVEVGAKKGWWREKNPKWSGQRSEGLAWCVMI
jgi:hypothetical protein